MVRDWCQYKGEDVSEDVGERGEDILSLLLLFNLDHCVDLIASSSSCVSVRIVNKTLNFQAILMSSPLEQQHVCVLLGGSGDSLF